MKTDELKLDRKSKRAFLFCLRVRSTSFGLFFKPIDPSFSAREKTASQLGVNKPLVSKAIMEAHR
jgi:hypothetical protein